MTTPKEILKLENKIRKLKSDHDYKIQNYKDEIGKLKTELDNERNASRTLTRTLKLNVKAARDEELKKCHNLVEQTRAQLNLKFKEELEKERKRLTEKYKTKKTSKFTNIFKVGDGPAKSKTSHVKELVKRLNGLQTGQCAGGKPGKCVTKTPSNDQISKKFPSGVASRHDSGGGDADSVTEEPIVPQIVPKQDFENCELENRLPEDDTMTEDGVVQDRNSVINSWTKVVGLETLYTLLSNEHLELQRSHLILQSNLRKEERTRKHLEEKVKYLNSLMLNQRSKQNVLINPINSSLSHQLDQSKEREAKLLEQLQELNDQNELLEFRVLELEQCNGVDHNLTKRTSSRTPDTDISDSGVISLSPSEDIYCSDSDLQDLKLEPATSSSSGTDMKERLTLLCQNLENVSERIVIQQAINLLRHYESRITGMEATIANMCQEVAMCRSLNSSMEESSSSSDRKSTRIIATVLPFSGLPNHCERENEDMNPDEDLMTIESPFRKMFRENDSMQESGIYFEEEDIGFHCQSTQTDASNQSRLSEELRKLSQIRQKLERDQEKEKYFKPIKEDKSKMICSRQELDYYKEGMERLELRLKMYESCGEEQNVRLKEMLERDEILKKQIRCLEEDNLKLRRENEMLDMEKCEYEELENDTRLQCQRLEVKLNTINEKKLELQTQLQQNIRLINSLKNNIEENDRIKQEAQNKIESLETTIGCYETTLNKTEQKNFELEEREIELKIRLGLLENILPVLILFNLNQIYERSRRMMAKRCIVDNFKNQSKSSSCDNSLTLECTELSSPFSCTNYNPTCSFTPRPIEHVQQMRIVHLHAETQTHFNEPSVKFNEYVDRNCNITKVNNIACQCDLIENDYCEENSKSTKNCENCTNVLSDKEDLEKIIKDLKLKEKIYEHTMQEADEMLINMETQYKVQIENLENKINVNEIELKQLKNELFKEREDNDRTNNANVELNNKIKLKENEKKQLNNTLECLRMQLEEEREEACKFREDVQSFRKLFETEKLKCKELELDLKEANNEIRDIENRIELKIKTYEKEIEKLRKKLEDQAVTNGELKEEVDTLENVVKELKNAIAHERYKRETLKMEMSEELQIKTKEVSELKRNLQGVGLKSTAQEMEEALALLEHSDEDEGCHLSITEIPHKLEKLTEKLAESKDHTKTCETCKSNLSVVVQDLMDQIANIKTTKLCQGPHSEDLYKMATLPRIKTKSLVKNKSPKNKSLSEKCQEKDIIILNLAYELKQLADKQIWCRHSALVDNFRKQWIEYPDFTKAIIVQYLTGNLILTPKVADRSPLELKIIKAVGSNSLLIAWKPPPADSSVLEFHVYINGEFMRKIYAEQGRALLHPVELQSLAKPIEVTLRSADSRFSSASAFYC